LEQTAPVRRAAGAEQAGLADALTELGRYAEARTAYEAALDTARAHDDERSVAAVLPQLGTLALRQGSLREARRCYLKALELDLQVGNPRDRAIDWHQLGMVAQKSREWDEAERCYRESLALEEGLGDKAGAAQTCNQLAMVAKHGGRPVEAERWYRRAIELGEQLNDVSELGKCYNNLASLLLNQGRLDEAGQYAHQAVEMVERHSIATEVWKMYALLADIAERRGWQVEAHAWRRKEQESFATFAGSAHRVQQFQPLVAAIVRAAQGEAQARQQVEFWLRHMEVADRGNQRFAASARRILAGDRNLAALTADLDHISALVVRQVLDSLTGSAVNATASRTSAVSSGQEGGFSVDQLLDLVGQALEGDRALETHLVPTLQALSRDLSAPPDLRALFDVLHRLLAGEQELDLSALAPEMAQRVQDLHARAGELVAVT
jgi:Tfp pilus assembly protein PilF